MKIYAQAVTLQDSIDFFIVPMFLKGDSHYKNMELPNDKQFKPKFGDQLLSLQGGKLILFVGIGAVDKVTPDKIREGYGLASKIMRKKQVKRAATLFPSNKLGIEPEILVESCVEGIILGSYKFTQLKSKKGNDRTVQVEDFIIDSTHLDLEHEQIERAIHYGKTVAEATNFTRDLGNLPHNHANAITLANKAKTMAEQNGLDVIVWTREQIAQHDMNLFLAVNQGSEVPPRFVLLEYEGDDPQQTIVLVGKGISFDTGGISLKDKTNMKGMIYDMCGAGAVLGAMQAIAQLQPKGIRVIGMTPLTDNSPSGAAYKPGDIIKSKSGQTVEIISTDAEGRLILADTLTFAEQSNPDLVIDLATLTGSSVIALGGVHAAVFYNDRVSQDIKEMLDTAGKYTGDTIWELPLDKVYLKKIKSEHADLKNSGGRFGGVSSSAIFLAQFAKQYPWCHLDIAGTATVSKKSDMKGYHNFGATGFGVRLLLDFIRRFTELNE